MLHVSPSADHDMNIDYLMDRWKVSSIVKGDVLRTDHKYHVMKSTGCH
jgi:hypothetical protein